MKCILPVASFLLFLGSSDSVLAEHKAHLLASEVPLPTSYIKVSFTLETIRQNFISSLLEGDGLAARKERAEYADFRSAFPKEFEKIQRMSQAVGQVASYRGERGSADDLIINLGRVFRWDTVYEDALKMGLTNARIKAILDGDPSGAAQPDRTSDSVEKRLQTLNNLKDQGLLTDEEYSAKRKAILDSL